MGIRHIVLFKFRPGVTWANPKVAEAARDPMGIRHIVLFKFRPGVTWANPKVAEAARMSESHGRHIDEIQEWWVGPDLCHRDISYDFAVMGLFADLEALGRYLAHPHHQQGVALWRDLATWVVIDLDENRARQASN